MQDYVRGGPQKREIVRIEMMWAIAKDADRAKRRRSPADYYSRTTDYVMIGEHRRRSKAVLVGECLEGGRAVGDQGEAGERADPGLDHGIAAGCGLIAPARTGAQDQASTIARVLNQLAELYVQGPDQESRRAIQQSGQVASSSIEFVHRRQGFPLTAGTWSRTLSSRKLFAHLKRLPPRYEHYLADSKAGRCVGEDESGRDCLTVSRRCRYVRVEA